MQTGAASYPMYDWPGTRAAAQRFWSAIRAAHGSGDPDMTRYDDAEHAWSDSRLLLSQTCGLPFRYRLKDSVRLVGTLDYGVPGCRPGYYRSCLVVRHDDPRRHLADFAATPFARNSVQSQSGWAAVESHLAEIGAGFRFRAKVLDTGSHAASVRAVADGRAGLASIDAVTWRFLKRYEPAAAQLRVLARTRPSPGLPLITGMSVDPEPLFHAVAAAIARLTVRDRRTLCLKGIVRIPASAYLAEPLPFPLAGAAGTLR